MFLTHGQVLLLKFFEKEDIFLCCSFEKLSSYCYGWGYLLLDAVDMYGSSWW